MHGIPEKGKPKFMGKITPENAHFSSFLRHQKHDKLIMLDQYQINVKHCQKHISKDEFKEKHIIQRLIFSTCG